MTKNDAERWIWIEIAWQNAANVKKPKRRGMEILNFFTSALFCLDFAHFHSLGSSLRINRRLFSSFSTIGFRLLSCCCRLLSGCFQLALRLLSGCFGFARLLALSPRWLPGCFSGCFHVVSGCSEVALKLLSGCSQVAFRLLPGCSQVALGVIEGCCFALILRLLAGCSYVVLHLLSCLRMWLLKRRAEVA